MKEKVAKLVTGTRAKVAMFAATVAAALPQIANAGMMGNATTDQDASSLVKSIIDVVVKIFPLVGAFFVVAGIFKLVMAYRNDQPEAQTAAAKDIVIGAVFIVFFGFVWTPISKVLFG